MKINETIKQEMELKRCFRLVDDLCREDAKNIGNLNFQMMKSLDNGRNNLCHLHLKHR